MKVIAFVGPSGTGKSYRALWVAKQNQIDFIIDDGLLIGNNKVLAGYSAKKEPNKFAATKRACFFDKKHTDEVRKAIKEHNPNSILIIGTSEDMANLIRKNLKLEEFSNTVYIKDVASKNEINTAMKCRKEEGKHVIPVPTFELKKTFSGYFMDAIKAFKKKGKDELVEDKTIIRPTYSYMGKYIIYDKVIKQLSEYVAYEMFNIPKISSVDVKINDGNVVIYMNVIASYDQLNNELIPKLQEKIKSEIERLTFMNVISINVILKGLQVNK